MKNIRSIIIEDEEFLAEQLHDLLTAFCPEIDLVGIAHTSYTAEQLINELKPDLIFMDIEMPERNAFQLLEKIGHRAFDIIFTTAHDHYALQSFDFNTIHYIVKPVTKESLIKAVQKFIDKSRETKNTKLEYVIDAMRQAENLGKKIHLPRMSGFSVVALDKIVRFEADGSYTKVFMKTEKNNKQKGEPELVSQSIKNFESQLIQHNFFRCHHSHLVNLNKVKGYIKGEGGTLELENGESIPVSKSKKEELLKRLKEI